MQAQRHSIELPADAAYYDRDIWEEWASRSSHSHNDEMASQGSCVEDASSLRAERDTLARALAAERQRAATAARAHDARLAELHGVIAELVRRRAADNHARAIPEEELSDECESTTQPAGEFDQDPDHSRTEQNDTSSALSPAELPTPQESKVPRENLSDLSDHGPRSEENQVEECPPPGTEATEEADARETDEEPCDTSLDLSEKESELALDTHRCADGSGAHGSEPDSCGRERGSPQPHPVYARPTGRCESRQAKLACRVRLRRTHDSDSNHTPRTDDERCDSDLADRLALEGGSAMVAHRHDGCPWVGRCARLRAERRVLQCALARAADTAHRLYCACALHESRSVSLCCALGAADRALEAYDVLLALAETRPEHPEREAAELVARQLLARLDEPCAAIGEPLLSPGPWLQHHHQAGATRWSPESEARLRAHAAALKAETVTLRGTQPPPKLFSYHDGDESESRAGTGGAAEMEEALALLDSLQHTSASPPAGGRRPNTRHWLHPRASETPL